MFVDGTVNCQIFDTVIRLKLCANSIVPLPRQSLFYRIRIRVRPLKLSDEGWESFFGKAGITDPVHQEAFKLLVQPFTRKESWTANEVEILLKPQVHGKIELNAKYLTVRDQRRVLRSQVDGLKSKLAVAQAELDARPYKYRIVTKEGNAWLAAQ